MSGRGIAILCALEMEAQALRPVAPVVHVIGLRARFVRREMLNGCSMVIVAGLAGGLAPDLRVGDIVIDGPLHIGGARLGRIHTTDQIIATTAQKAAMFQQTGALAADMESAVVRQMAEEIGLPFAAIRAISDTAADELDADLLQLIDDRGRARPAAAGMLILKSPSRLPQLMRLRANATKALSNLRDVIARV